MLFPRILLAVTGLVFFVHGLVCFIHPATIGLESGLAMPTPSSVIEVRAEYGGLPIALGLFFLAAALVVLRGLLRTPPRATLARIVYGLGALFLVVCAGEEISWGQRLFGFASPDALEAVNKQGETNWADITTRLEAADMQTEKTGKPEKTKAFRP